MGVGCSQDAEAECGSYNDDGFADTAGIVAAVDERVREESGGEIREGGEEPRDSGVKEGMEKVDVQRRGEVTGQPHQQQVEDVVVGAEADSEAENFALAEKITEGCRGLNFLVGVGFDVFGDVEALVGAEFGVVFGVSIDA